MKRKSILFLSLITMSFAGFSQTTFGIKAGVQSSALRLNIEEGDTKAVLDGTSIGFLIGGTADIKFADNWSFQPNLLFAMKNGSLVLLGSGKSQIFTVDVPLNLLYRHQGFFVGAGPNFSYGLSAKIKPYDDSDPDIDLYKKDGDEAPFKRFEFGINSLIGYEFPSGFTLSANFTPGLTDLLNEGGDGAKIHNTMFGINFGYIFSKSGAKKK